MMVIRILFLLLCISFWSGALQFAAAEESTAPTMTEEQKMEKIRSYFQSEYQEEDYFRTDRLLLTATGSLKAVHKAPSVASVITAEDIEAIGATNLDEILETVPGLHVAPSGSSWFSSIWSIRGIHTSVNPEVLLLINGVPFTSNYVGNRQFEYRMPVSMISRVEVIRGPGSALYGAEAFSGVVNVITKDNFEIDGTNMGARAGSFDTYDGWLQHGSQYGGWGIALGIEWQKSDGDDERIVEYDYLHAIGAENLSNAPGPLDTHYETLDANLQLRKENWDFHLYGQLLESAMGPGGAQAIVYETKNNLKSLLTDLTYDNDHRFKNWDLSCRLYYSYMHADAFIQYFPTAFLNMLGNPIQMSQDGGVELAAIYDGLQGHKLRFGTGWKNYEFEPDQYKNFGPSAGANQFGSMVHITDPNEIYISDANRQLFYGLIQDEWDLARHWELTVGMRYDKYSDFGSTVNPRVALVWETRYDLTTKLLYGRAFRAPSFAEQYVKNNPVGIGNENLDPETIQTIEFAFDYQPTEGMRLKLNIFHYKADDLIALAGSTAPLVFENIDKQKGSGFEFEAAWQITKRFQLKGYIAYQDSENESTGEPVADAPGWQTYLNGHLDFYSEWSLDAQWFWIGDRERTIGDPRFDIDNFNWVNLTLRRKNIGDHLDVAISVRNLFDEDAREPSPYDETAPLGAFIPYDYPMESRSIFGEVRVYF